MSKSPLILIILDGWGHREEIENNAIAQALKPHYDRFWREYPHAVLDASGHSVGLPQGVMGNSEVGHLTMGAGRVALVGLTRIYHAIEDGSFFENPALLQACRAAKEKQSTLHLMGLLSDGAVHSHQDHLEALLEMAKRQGVARVAIHAFTDGRDTPPTSGLGYLQKLQDQIQKIGSGEIATIIGRYYAMDRDKRWERTQLAYQAIVAGEGRKETSVKKALESSYQKGETDEFLKPIVMTDARGKPVATIGDGDAAIFFNFRADRARQLTHALTDPDFSGFPRALFPKIAQFVCMAQYDKTLRLLTAFPPVHFKNTLGELLAHRGLKQLRIAETEKYAHVTFFFNGGEENVFPGEERILIPSPREVPTYDLKPEMSAPQLTAEVLKMIHEDRYDVMILNFANADMVGHSGNLSAAIRAVEAVDEQLGKIEAAIRARAGTLLITADHGNSEQMNDEKGNAHTAHTTNLVPLLLVGEKWKGAKLRKEGTLIDIAPTMLHILSIPKPKEMTGRNMIDE